MGAPPKTLPANFDFGQKPPDTLPANFFDSQNTLEAQKHTSSEQIAKDLGIGALKGLGQVSAEIGQTIHNVPVVGPAIIPQEGLQAEKQITTPTNTAQQVGAAAGNLAGNAALVEAGGQLVPEAALANMHPLAQAAIRAVLQGGTGAALSPNHPLEGAAIGAGAEGVAQGLRALAPQAAETALRVGNKARAFGKTPGDAAIQATHGWTPETVYESANQAIDGTAQQLEQLYANTKESVSLKPALRLLDDARETAVRRNNKDAIDAIDSLRERLTKNVATGKPIPEDLAASRALDLKRGIGEAASWNPNAQSTASKKLLRQVYHSIDSELDRVAPQGSELNQRISSLIEVRNRAEQLSRNAGVIQNVAHRVAAHTGALTGAAAGAYGGYRADGPEGAVIGGLAGAVLPEVLSSPAGQMAIARGLNAAPEISRPVAIPLWSLYKSEEGK